MELKGATAVVTGANRGLGRHLAEQLIQRGAKVYAAARRPETIDIEGAVPLRIDVTDEAGIREAARIASDATTMPASRTGPRWSRARWTRSARRWTPTSTARSPGSGPSPR
jgi:NAD(P)-dependent dehydrogenase (short-subunit alcohol dehydrogenase family)